MIWYLANDIQGKVLSEAHSCNPTGQVIQEWGDDQSHSEFRGNYYLCTNNKTTRSIFLKKKKEAFSFDEFVFFLKVICHFDSIFVHTTVFPF